MRISVFIESLVAGLAMQAVVGWINPLTPIFTCFIAGMIARKKKDGAITGLIIGILTALGFVLRGYIHLSIPYLYPVQSFLNATGAIGYFIVPSIMIVVGVIGGAVGGSLMDRALSASYLRGKAFGEAESDLMQYKKRRGRGA